MKHEIKMNEREQSNIDDFSQNAKEKKWLHCVGAEVKRKRDKKYVLPLLKIYQNEL